MEAEATTPLLARRRAIVIGGSSGIGAALVGKLCAQGYTVAALARRGKLLEQVCADVNSKHDGARVALAYEHDVTAPDQIPVLFRQVTRDLGGLDLIVYAAAVQPAMSIDEFDSEKDAAIFRVNVLGAMAWLNEAARRFQQTGSGHIVGISSITGERGRVASPAYSASKAALNTYLEGLRNRLSRKGVTVTTIKPGFVDTALLANAARTFWVVTPEEAARQIYAAIAGRKQTVYVPARWWLVGLAVRMIPSVIFRRLSF